MLKAIHDLAFFLRQPPNAFLGLRVDIVLHFDAFCATQLTQSADQARINHANCSLKDLQGCLGACRTWE